VRMLLLIVTLASGFLLEGVASAKVTAISVTSDRQLGTFAGKPYREAALQIRGVAPAGPYSVPAVLAYPTRAADANGFALVEPYNTAGFWFRDEHVPETPLAHVRNILGDDYLFGRGNVFIAVLWDKVLMEDTDQGFMTAGSDGYQVVRDASALVRSPRSMPYPRGFAAPPAARKVVAAGYSSSTNLLRDFYLNGENSRRGLAFDGALFAGSSGQCMNPATPAIAYACGGVVSDGGNVLVVNTETDVEFAGFAERGRTSDYRVQELAGVAHIPPSIFDWRADKPDQNPVSGNPAFRAAHTNLLRWIEGWSRPPSRFLELQDVPPVDVGGFPYVPVARDADGNAIGGIRLPHMTSRWRGRPAGAPLGSYTGVDLNTLNPFFFLAGTFTPFSPARLAELYPTREVYVDRVRRAADRLLAERHILRSDRDAYVAAAEHR
jgi:Alpha/beta hydrolase domain